MKKQFAVLALAFAVSNAFAGNCGNDKDVGNADCDKPGSVNPLSPNVTINPTINPSISVNPSVVNRNLQGQQQGQQQGQVAIGGSVRNSGNSFNNNTNTANGGTGIGIGGNGFGGAGGAGGEGGSAMAGASSSAAANNSGNTQSITFTGPEKTTVKSTGEAPSVLGSATAPCRVAVGASAGWLGGAFGIGTSVMDESCNLREISRHLWNLGLKTEAIKVMCADETAKAAMGNLCQ